MARNRRASEPILLIVACALIVAACGRDPGDERLEGQDAPPAAAMLSPGVAAESLDDQLERLRVELEAGMAGDPERLLRAEAITDGLMEARRPFDWLGTGYDVEARLRQLQAMADRVVAKLRRGAPLSEVAEDVETMRLALTDLRAQLQLGSGGPAPPSLDSLLAQDPLRDVGVGGRAPERGAPETETAADPAQPEQPATPATPAPPPRPRGPLGQPVDTSRLDR